MKHNSKPEQKQIRIVVADDHHIVRQGICALLQRSERVEIVGEACNGFEALALAEELQPDILIMDISMPKMDGIQATAEVTKRDAAPAVIILSMHSKPAIVQEVLKKGAKGYLLKTGLSAELMLALEAVSRGQTFLSPSISDSILDIFWALQKDTGETGLHHQLTPRERQVLQLIAEGYTNTAMAQELVVSVKTVEKHRRNLVEKLGVKDTAGLIRYAIRYDLVFLE